MFKALSGRFGNVGSLFGFALAYTGSAVIQKAIGFGIFLWFAQALPVEEYALFGLMYSLQVGVASLALAGLVETTIGGMRTANSDTEMELLLGRANLTIILTAGLSAFGCGITTLAFTSYGPGLIATASASGAVIAYCTIQSQLYRIVEKHSSALLFNFTPPVGGMLTGMLVGFYHKTSLGFFAGFLVGIVIVSLAIGLASTRASTADIKPRRPAFAATAMAPFAIIAFFEWLSGYGTTFLMEWSFSAQDVATFVFAYTIASVLHLVATSLNQVWSPRIFSYLRNGMGAEIEQQNRIFYTAQAILIGIAGAVLLAALYASEFVGGGFKYGYGDIAPGLLFLFLSYVVMIPWYHAQNYYYYHSAGKKLMGLTLMSGVSGVAAWLVAAEYFGPLGGYIGFFAMVSIKVAVGAYAAKKKWGLTICWEGPLIGASILIATYWLLTSPF